MSARFLLLLFLAPILALAAAWWRLISPGRDEQVAPRWRRSFLFGSILSASVATIADMFFAFHELTIADGKIPQSSAIWHFAGPVAGILILSSMVTLALGKGSARAFMLGWIVTIVAVTYIGMLPLLAY